MTFHQRFINAIKKYRKIFLIVFVGLNIVAFIGLFRIRIDTDFSIFMPSNSKALEEYEEMSKKFGSSEQLIFLLKSDETDVEKVLNDFFRIQKKIEETEGVNFLNGPIPPAVPTGLTISPVTGITDDNYEKILEYTKKMRSLKAFYKEEDAYYGLYTVMPDPDKIEETSDEVLCIFEQSGLEFYKTGDTYLQTSIFDYILKIIFFIPPIAIILILCVFRWQIGNFKGTFLSIFPAGIGALWTMGLLGWTSLDLSVITVLTPIFTIVMGSADGLHFISHIQDEVKKRIVVDVALSKTLQKVGWPMILTTLTTIAGFMSLLVIQSEPMRQLAFTASVGILLAGIVTWVFLPVIYIGIKKPVKEKKNKTFDPVTPLLHKSMGKPSVIITLVISFAFVPGIFLIKTDLNMLSFYKEKTEVRQSIDKISKITGGSIPLFIEFISVEDPLSGEIAERVSGLEKELMNSGAVTKTVSIYDVFTTLNQIIFRAEEDEFPGTARANLMYNMFSSVQPGEVENTLVRDENLGRMIVFPANLSNEVLKEIIRISGESSDEKITFKPLGTPLVIKEMNDRIIPDQVGSILLAILMVFVLLWFTLKSFKMSLISIIPLGSTLIALFGFMGYAGISLSIVTSTIASITIGVGIDYSVHFTSIFKTFYKEYDSKTAAEKAFEYVSKPVLANALGLSIGLTALIFSPLKFHTYMSMLMWVSMLTSSFISLTFLPTVLRKSFAKKDLKKK